MASSALDVIHVLKVDNNKEMEVTQANQELFHASPSFYHSATSSAETPPSDWTYLYTLLAILSHVGTPYCKGNWGKKYVFGFPASTVKMARKKEVQNASQAADQLYLPHFLIQVPERPSLMMEVTPTEAIYM
jgi:hypothetical protein